MKIKSHETDMAKCKGHFTAYSFYSGPKVMKPEAWKFITKRN